MRIAGKRKSWPKYEAPVKIWELTVADVLKVVEGEERNGKIKEWGESVWKEWKKEHLLEIEKLVMPLLD